MATPDLSDLLKTAESQYQYTSIANGAKWLVTKPVAWPQWVGRKYLPSGALSTVAEHNILANDKAGVEKAIEEYEKYFMSGGTSSYTSKTGKKWQVSNYGPSNWWAYPYLGTEPDKTNKLEGKSESEVWAKIEAYDAEIAKIAAQNFSDSMKAKEENERTLLLGTIAVVAGLGLGAAALWMHSRSRSESSGKWYIKNPNTQYARVEFASKEDIPFGATSGDDYMALMDEAARQRSVASHNLYNRPTGVCAFCGGPTPCFHDD